MSAASPKRRVIKLTSVKELRTEITENTHKGKQDTYHKLFQQNTWVVFVLLQSTTTQIIFYLSTQFSSAEHLRIFSRSSRNAAEPLVCGLRESPVDSDPASHQTVPAQHHQVQVSQETRVASSDSLCCFMSQYFFFLLQPGAFLSNTDLRLWELWRTKTLCK